MKNPFPHKLMIYSLQEGRLVNAGAGGEFTREQADYIAYVFNQHEKLVEMLRKQQRIMMTFCGYCGGNPCRPDCELAALLDEEKP